MDSHIAGSSQPDSSTTSDLNGAADPADFASAEFDAACASRDEMKDFAKRIFLHVDDLRVFLDNGFRLETVPTQNNFSRRQMLAYLKKKGQRPPK